ncbi:hypothetical protein C1H46_000361 [Malus baccata]|uniref:Uncharacterized protein n=1 Tax=Malus baccata TaxID=106549 RepID=A0A540NSS9_MALBA|nr:hypothetical protein C1H46_000361 [Malus baccata]
MCLAHQTNSLTEVGNIPLKISIYRYNYLTEFEYSVNFDRIFSSFFLGLPKSGAGAIAIAES